MNTGVFSVSLCGHEIAPLVDTMWKDQEVYRVSIPAIYTFHFTHQEANNNSSSLNIEYAPSVCEREVGLGLPIVIDIIHMHILPSDKGDDTSIPLRLRANRYSARMEQKIRIDSVMLCKS